MSIMSFAAIKIGQSIKSLSLSWNINSAQHYFTKN